jgi:hypothetical protein
VSPSNAEAEYRIVANVVHCELHSPPCRATLVYNNISVVYMSSNPVQHQSTKHIEIDLHFVWERVPIGGAHVLHVPTSSQYVEIFTKWQIFSLKHKPMSSISFTCSNSMVQIPHFHLEFEAGC